MTVKQLYYPDDIENSNFDNRRVIFMALTGETNETKSNYLRGIIKTNQYSDDEFNKTSNSSNDNPYKNLINDSKKYLNFDNVFESSDEDSGVLNKIKNIFNKSKEYILNFNQSELKCLITLPLPGTLADNQSHNWQQESYLNAISSGISEITSIIPIAGKGLENVTNKLTSVVEGYSKVSGAVTNILGMRKPSLNPGFFQNYTNSGLRTFSFTFNFIPESSSEAQNIINIIKAFKNYSSPSKWSGSDYFLLSPYKWFINVSNGIVNELLSLQECVCTSVNVSYGNDKFDCFDDGMPKKITLSLNFSECSLQYADNYETSETINNSLINENNLKLINSINNISNAIKTASEKTIKI